MSTLEFILAMAGVVFASTGLWTFLNNLIQKKTKKQDALTRLILGLGHEKIVENGLKYVERGYVTKDEYDDLLTYLYNPYKELGGDGTAEKIIDAVKRLPIKEK